jgi:hypothetical protein
MLHQTADFARVVRQTSSLVHWLDHPQRIVWHTLCANYCLLTANYCSPYFRSQRMATEDVARSDIATVLSVAVLASVARPSSSAQKGCHTCPARSPPSGLTSMLQALRPARPTGTKPASLPCSAACLALVAVKTRESMTRLPLRLVDQDTSAIIYNMQIPPTVAYCTNRCATHKGGCAGSTCQVQASDELLRAVRPQHCCQRAAVQVVKLRSTERSQK